MTPESILAMLALYLFFATVFVYIVYRFAYYRAKQMQNKYFLYKVRDDLILLAVRGQLDEDEFLFREFYPIVNELVNQINSFRFKHILRAIRSQEGKVMKREFVENFQREIAGKPKEVVKVFNDFFSSIFYIIYRNSLIFRLFLRLVQTFGVMKCFVERIATPWRVFSSQLLAYRYASFYDSMISR